MGLLEGPSTRTCLGGMIMFEKPLRLVTVVASRPQNKAQYQPAEGLQMSCRVRHNFFHNIAYFIRSMTIYEQSTFMQKHPQARTWKQLIHGVTFSHVVRVVR
jgi:hypothetical protein